MIYIYCLQQFKLGAVGRSQLGGRVRRNLKKIVLDLPVLLIFMVIGRSIAIPLFEVFNSCLTTKKVTLKIMLLRIGTMIFTNGDWGHSPVLSNYKLLVLFVGNSFL